MFLYPHSSHKRPWTKNMLSMNDLGANINKFMYTTPTLPEPTSPPKHSIAFGKAHILQMGTQKAAQILNSLGSRPWLANKDLLCSKGSNQVSLHKNNPNRVGYCRSFCKKACIRSTENRFNKHIRSSLLHAD